MNNILTAITAIVESPLLKTYEEENDEFQNRANQMGAVLEDFVKNAFANCLGMDKDTANKARNKTFAYLGNNTNPPDAVLKGGDAIEIKKLSSSVSSQLQLNSSYPKNKLYSDNPKICNKCRYCEEWDVKDMLYVVGHVEDKELKSIFFIYGDIYCDSKDIYINVENIIKDGLQSIEGVEFAETKELARINKIDHLGISDLRVRGMWLIKSPFLHFDYLTEKINNYKFKLVALIPVDKYNSFENVVEFEEFCKTEGVNIVDKELEDPQNPANLISTKLITYYI